MPDIDFITKTIAEATSYLDILRKRKGITANQLSQNTEELWIVAHGLQLTIQILLDIGTHILSDLNERHWEKYSDIPQLLMKQRILLESSANSFSQMIGMRNILAHEYLFLDANKIAEVINKNLEDIPDILLQYQNYIEKGQ